MIGPHSELIFDENYKLTELSGILPRTAQYIFSELERRKNKLCRNYTVNVSSLEIYNDQLRDLYSNELENKKIENIKGKCKVKDQIWK